MLLFFLLIILAAVTAMALSFIPLRVRCLVDTTVPELWAEVRWSKAARADARFMGGKLYLAVFVFERKMTDRPLGNHGGKQDPWELMEAAALSETTVTAAFGFFEPQWTGFFSGLAAMSVLFRRGVSLQLEPDFMPEAEYVRVQISTVVNVGRTLINLLLIKVNKVFRRKAYGSA